MAELESALEASRAQVANAERELTAMRQTKLFRWSKPLRALYRLVGGRR